MHLGIIMDTRPTLHDPLIKTRKAVYIYQITSKMSEGLKDFEKLLNLNNAVVSFRTEEIVNFCDTANDAGSTIV
jgi:hypothetical protein